MDEGFVSLRQALANFADSTATQSQSHIKLLHWHIAERLVLEGGFHPDSVVPHPPLRAKSRGSGNDKQWSLIHDPEAAHSGELTILGGLKTKAVDVVITKHGIGPCLAISVKGTLNAFRNLTNRMEEAAGDCTNIHISYPNLVYGFLHVIRANREEETERPNDVAVGVNGDVTIAISRYHDAIARLGGRRDVRNDVSRYEAICLALIDTSEGRRGSILESFPAMESRIHFERFFETLYRAYDSRYVYPAPALQRETGRLCWDPESPAFDVPNASEFDLRIADS